MRKLDLIVPFEWFENIANGKHHYKKGDDIEFLPLLHAAIKEVDDDCIIMLVADIPVNFLSQRILRGISGIEHIIISEYVRRRLETIAKEQAAQAAEVLAKEALEKLKHQIHKHPSYTGFTTIPEEDIYNTYTTAQFEAEIDWHCKRSLNASLVRDREGSAYHSMKASILSSRLDKLKMRIKALKGFVK